MKCEQPVNNLSENLTPEMLGVVAKVRDYRGGKLDALAFRLAKRLATDEDKRRVADMLGARCGRRDGKRYAAEVARVAGILSGK